MTFLLVEATLLHLCFLLMVVKRYGIRIKIIAYGLFYESGENSVNIVPGVETVEIVSNRCWNSFLENGDRWVTNHLCKSVI